MNLNTLAAWKPSGKYTRVTTLDVHTAGEPLRIIIDGFPELHGATILERRRYAVEHLDHFRQALMREPRGHPEMYGCLITPPVTPSADFGVLFMHNEGYSTMCGHGIIAVSMAVLETGLFPTTEPETVLDIDTPAGPVRAVCPNGDNRIHSVRFRNVPSFVQSIGHMVDVPGIGRVQYDIAFGGAFYAFVNASDLGLSCRPEEQGMLIEQGMRIKKAVMATELLEHPFEPDLNFLYGTIFIAPAMDNRADSRNVCIFADGQLDRSPTGTGVSARMALHYAKGEIARNQPIVIESIIGTTFTGTVAETTTFGRFDAVLPEVEGTAHITGRHEFLIDMNDPIKHGFLLG